MTDWAWATLGGYVMVFGAVGYALGNSIGGAGLIVLGGLCVYRPIWR